MSNERIDLTQFNSEKEWDLTGFDWLAKQADSEYVANAVRQTPDLIAELKRCYDLIDAANRCIDQASKELQNCADCGGHREEEGLLHECQNYSQCYELFDESASE